MVCLHIYVCIDSCIEIPSVEVHRRVIRVLTQKIPASVIRRTTLIEKISYTYHAARIRVARSCSTVNMCDTILIHKRAYINARLGNAPILNSADQSRPEIAEKVYQRLEVIIKKLATFRRSQG